MSVAGIKTFIASCRAPFLGPAGKIKLIERGRLGIAKVVKYAIRADDPMLRTAAAACAILHPELAKGEVKRYLAGPNALRSLLLPARTAAAEKSRAAELGEQVRRSEIVKTAVAEGSKPEQRQAAIGLINQAPTIFIEWLAQYLFYSEVRIARTNEVIYPERMRAASLLKDFQLYSSLQSEVLVRIEELLKNAPPMHAPLVRPQNDPLQLEIDKLNRGELPVAQAAKYAIEPATDMALKKAARYYLQDNPTIAAVNAVASYLAAPAGRKGAHGKVQPEREQAKYILEEMLRTIEQMPAPAAADNALARLIASKLAPNK
jgi:hypothetical protein